MRFISRLKYNSNCPVVVMTLLVNHYHPVVMRGDVDKTTFLGLFDLTRLGPPNRSGHSIERGGVHFLYVNGVVRAV